MLRSSSGKSPGWTLLPAASSPRSGSRCGASLRWSSLALIIPVVFLANIQSFTFSSPESEIFSSTTELRKLYQNELEVVRTLQEYANLLEKNLQVVQNYITDFNKITSSDDEGPVEIVENPMNAYHILKRTVVDWEVVADTIKNHTHVGDLAGEVIKKAEQLPTFDDFIGGSVALVSLQDTYALIIPESEIFSSTTELRKLYQNELEVVRTLQEYANLLEKNLQVVQNYITDFNKITSSDDEGPVEIVENPMNAYHILKRTVVDWEVVADTIKNHTHVGDLAGEVIKKAEQLPTFDDFIGGSVALVSLQDTYALNLTDIIHGALSSETRLQKSPYELSAKDCLFLGKSAFNKGLYDRALGWFEMALSRANEESEDKAVSLPGGGVPQDDILLYIKDTSLFDPSLLKILENRGSHGETWQTFERPLNVTLAKAEKYQMVRRYQPKIMVPLIPVEENENFKALCRGEYLRSPKLDASLRCRYVHRPNAISFLGPFKLEEYSKDPFIAMYHDFMSDSEMATFRNTATSRLKRSLHQGRDGRYIATDIRTSKHTDDSPLIDTISRRIGDATNLEVFPETVASEIYQVANYGMAGRYTPHTDYISGEDHLFNPLELVRGNRIATFMVYLEDVQAGGSTVFPLIGVQVKPTKGSAVFWWNLRNDGRGDPWTRHAGCSVLYGNKWITNKWIRYNDQFKKVPCVAEPNHTRNEMFQTLAY